MAWEGMYGKGVMCDRGPCVAGGMRGGGSMHGRGACVAGGMHDRYHEIQSMDRWYASFWNAFLYLRILVCYSVNNGFFTNSVHYSARHH